MVKPQNGRGALFTGGLAAIRASTCCLTAHLSPSSRLQAGRGVRDPASAQHLHPDLLDRDRAGAGRARLSLGPCLVLLTPMFNKDTPKHETCVPCVGRVSTRHGRLKSALRHAILVGCERCFTLTRSSS